VPSGDKCGDGAVWSAADCAVFWAGINCFLIRRYDLASDSFRSWFLDGPLVAIALTTGPDHMLVALASKLIRWRPKTDRRQDFGFALPG